MRAEHAVWLVGMMALASVLLMPATGRAQNVNFQFVPMGGTVVNPGPNPTLLVQPGFVLPFEVLAEVLSDPNAPTNVGLAGFDFNILTEFGLPQTTPFTFAPSVSPLFPANQSLGSPITDDIVGISGFQDLGAGSVITTGFAVNQPQTLGTGQLLTPSFEGTFGVSLVGNADLLTLAGDRTMTTVPAIVGTSPHFTIIVRLAENTMPVTPPDDEEEEPPSEIPGGTSGPVGPVQPSDEQVAGEPPEGPGVSAVTPGICGLGAVSALAFALLGLAMIKRHMPLAAGPPVYEVETTLPAHRPDGRASRGSGFQSDRGKYAR